MKDELVKRFIDYVKFDTQSSYDSQTFPSTEKQILLAKKLAEDCKKIGLTEVELNEFGYVTACLPKNTEKNIPCIGFLSHYDTSPDFSGKNVNPQFVKNYDGNDINLLNGNKISVNEFPILKNYIGQTIITTDGTTLLGADDKAGVSEILTAMDYLIKNNEIEHGKIMIAFSPDEEIGRGMDNFNVEKFGADFAYTLDGGKLGEFEYESFNAARAKISIEGKIIHPGQAKDIMVNSILIANELITMLPKDEIPAKTSGYEGFFHITNLVGSVPVTKFDIIIRDFDKIKFTNRKELIIKIVDELNKKYNNRLELVLKDEYYNMGEIIEQNKKIIDLALQSYKDVGVNPIVEPIRGGTDGSRLSYMGLPCPNIFTGGHNFHGPLEFIPIESMLKAVLVVVKIIENIAK